MSINSWYLLHFFQTRESLDHLMMHQVFLWSGWFRVIIAKRNQSSGFWPCIIFHGITTADFTSSCTFLFIPPAYKKVSWLQVGSPDYLRFQRLLFCPVCLPNTNPCPSYFACASAWGYAGMFYSPPCPRAGCWVEIKGKGTLEQARGLKRAVEEGRAL